MVSRVCFDQSGVLVTSRELGFGDTRLGAEIYIKLDPENTQQDTAEFSAESRNAAAKLKSAA